MDKEYHLGRKTKKSLVYRLNRRTREVINSIERHFSGCPSLILDVGAADGLMLGMIKNAHPSTRCLGIELSKELIETNTDKRITLLQGSANDLPVEDGTVDIIIATAIIEHLPDPLNFLQESRRALKTHGLIIATSPVPVWEKIATMAGHLKDEEHCNVMNMRELVALFQGAKYKIVESRKFMLSPIGLPLESIIEKTVRKIGLNFLFANQLLIGQKRNSDGEP